METKSKTANEKWEVNCKFCGMGNLEWMHFKPCQQHNLVGWKLVDRAGYAHRCTRRK